ncbi:hypothetical protein BO70DRAFT_431024 [Aspergillus heteromorphus CBS 117.55]|uniref:Uncharacterized protein n=1 Tax=Aspergillus heteromorphus CBS 117.55 TaxID=1448321 RepID=A0A317VQ83_9EURO|nr:uncharacterized protein BO70DRAFT_431024 [Aspergillus heteromorphus CBS 117.55]PWY75032.1 hypothetical protein BO70DRAFT_431024 [Aspergillus heteromorphus CBS 117.55]
MATTCNTSGRKLSPKSKAARKAATSNMPKTVSNTCWGVILVIERLNLEIQPYTGPPHAPGRLFVKPLGTVELEFIMMGPRKPRRAKATFLVVKDIHYDLVIGRQSMRELQLYRADPMIAEWYRFLQGLTPPEALCSKYRKYWRQRESTPDNAKYRSQWPRFRD